MSFPISSCRMGRQIRLMERSKSIPIDMTHTHEQCVCMSVRIHLVMAEEEKARMERAAKAQGLTLSAWLRDAARERLESVVPPGLSSVDELRGFFAQCDRGETGHEPDWEAHRRVIEASKTRGAPDR